MIHTIIKIYDCVIFYAVIFCISIILMPFRLFELLEEKEYINEIQKVFFHFSIIILYMYLVVISLISLIKLLIML